jgi:signal transduction histidine kinase/DNA-binding response OmpR family regulator
MAEVHRVALVGEPDLVQVRRLVRRLVQLLEFEERDEVRITAAVSELTRAAWAPRGGGVELSFSVEDDAAAPRLLIDVTGPGLAPANRRSGSSAAEGVVAAEKLLERAADPMGPAALRFAKPLPARTAPVPRSKLAVIRAELERIEAPRTEVSEELVHQSHELARALLDLEERRQELATLNAELADTNRGVVALYAELDERANHLRRADELKTRFFSHMSHEFRTPLSSILALSNMLLDETDGPLNSEQKRQVGMIRDGVADLLELVGDLLDLAKMEAGKTQISVAPFAIGTMLGALRAMIRPLLGASVSLELGNASELPPLVSDEAKVMQILRNFLSNAVKFTEAGTITVSARLVPAGEPVAGVAVETDNLLFAVADTGIGIAPEHQAAIFEEFRQVENRLQRKLRGSGLGLPLCRRLAGLLGGRVWVESRPGQGSTFYLLLPRVHESAVAGYSDDLRPRLLIVDERPERRAALGELFSDSAFLPIEAANSEVTSARLAALQPTAAIVDTAHTAPAALDALRAAAVELVLVPTADESGREQIVAATYRAVLRTKLRRILIVDDDEAYRTILGRQLAPFCEGVRVAEGGREALAAIRAGQVDCVVLDLIMPEVDGLTVLQWIRDDEASAQLPVVVCSSKALTADEQAQLRRLHAPFLPKDGLGAPQVARALLDARRLVGAFGRSLTENAA